MWRQKILAFSVKIPMKLAYNWFLWKMWHKAEFWFIHTMFLHTYVVSRCSCWAFTSHALLPFPHLCTITTKSIWTWTIFVELQMVGTSCLVPKPEEEEKKGHSFSRLRMCLIAVEFHCFCILLNCRVWYFVFWFRLTSCMSCTYPQLKFTIQFLSL